MQRYGDTVPTWRMRAKAVFCCLYFGVLPWWVYEIRCHYATPSTSYGYWAHLRLNLGRAWVWLFGDPPPHEIEFEQRVNTRPNWTRWHHRVHD